MKPAIFHSEALEESVQIIRFYRNQYEGLAVRFNDDLESAIKEVCKHPEIYRKVDHETRKRSLETFPYAIIYRDRHDHIEIVAVMHKRREPGYWKHRH